MDERSCSDPKCIYSQEHERMLAAFYVQHNELEQLRASLTILRECMLRMVCSTPGVIHLKREDWQRAFDPLIVPPYNRLRWQSDSADGGTK